MPLWRITNCEFGQEFNVGYTRYKELCCLFVSSGFSSCLGCRVTRMARRPATTVHNYHRSYYILACIFVLFLINQFCIILLEVPRVRLFERVICDRYYKDHDERLLVARLQIREDSGSKEELCKLPEIQSELATVIGIKTALDAIPGLLSFQLRVAAKINQGWTLFRSPHSFLFWVVGGQDWENSRRFAQRYGRTFGFVVDDRHMYARVAENQLFDCWSQVIDILT